MISDIVGHIHGQAILIQTVSKAYTKKKILFLKILKTTAREKQTAQSTQTGHLVFVI